MNNIKTVDPKQVVENSQSDIFQIILVTFDGHFIYVGNGFSNMEHAAGGFGNGLVFNKKSLVENYQAASRFARSDFGVMPFGNTPIDGELHIVEIPKFNF